MKFRSFSSLFVFIVLFVASQAVAAGWRIPTPRDTVIVQANKKSPGVATKPAFTPPAGTEVMFRVSGVFNELTGNALFDAGYVYKFPGWNLPLPLRTSPPYVYGGQPYEFGLYYTTTPGLPKKAFIPIEPSADIINHNYSAKVLAAGSQLNLWIQAPNDTYYPQATGSLKVILSRWTAGIAVKSFSLNFGNVPYGQPSTLLDSIASYGEDPLKVDSVYFGGKDPGMFTYLSQRDVIFTLPNEQANEFKITFTPTRAGDCSAYMYIICKNADASNRKDSILLTGFGAKPVLGITPDTIDFGKVRIGAAYASDRNALCSNPGNATLQVTKTAYSVTKGLPDVVFSRSFPNSLPSLVSPGSDSRITTQFAPKRRVKYEGKLNITGNDKSLTDSIYLFGEGAEPIPHVRPDSRLLNFGSVYSGDKASQNATLTNEGNWPVHVVLAEIVGPRKLAFNFTPNETDFVVAPDSTRKFTITFNPNTGIEGNIKVYFVLHYDDLTQDSILLSGDELSPRFEFFDSDVYFDFGKVRLSGFPRDTVTHIRNKENSSLTLVQYEIRPSKDFTLLNPIYTIPSNSTIASYVEFRPTVQGVSRAWLYATSSGGQKDSLLLLGEGAIAKAIFNPSPADFGIVKSDSADTLAVTLSDSGNLALKVIKYEITGPDAADFKVVEVLLNGTPPIPALPFIVAEGTSVIFKVRFQTGARTGAAHRARLCVYYDDNTSDCLDLQAIEESQFVQFGVPGVDFGKVRVKTSALKDALFRNNSNLTLNISKVEITPPSAEFSIAGSLNPVKPKDSIGLAIKFAPTTTGNFSSFLKASGGDFRTDSIQIRGIGAAPKVYFNQDTLRWTATKINTLVSYVPQLTAINIGNWQLNVINVFIRNNTYNEFDFHKVSGGGGVDSTKLLIESPDTSNAIGIYDVTFQPNTTSVFHTADLVFLLDDSSEAVVKLIGLDESPNLVLGEDTLDLGKVRLGNGSFASASAYLINTSQDTLTADKVWLKQTGTEFKAKPLGKITVLPNLPNRQFPVDVTFTPTVLGQVKALLISEGGGATTDTTVLLGTGANPIAQFTPDTVLDFGDVLYTTSLTRTFILHNIGNWNFTTTKVEVIGTNKLDFTPTIAQVFNVEEDSSLKLDVTFKATTALQAGDRTATLVFTLDDSSTVTYELLARDREAFKTDIRFDNSAARVGDIVYPYLRLTNMVPDSLNVNHLTGTITYDATVVNLEQVTLSEALAKDYWTLTDTPPTSSPGTYTYSMQSSTTHLHNPVSLLRLKFRPHDTDKPGAQTIITHLDFSYPTRVDVQAILTDGVIVIDSACGNTHVSSGTAKASFADQNHPNPFSIAIGSTKIPFDIGDDDVLVTLRILDMTGREVSRPINNLSFKRGRYEMTIDATTLSSGTYFYEFQAAGMKPQIKKMVVGK